MPHPKRLVDAPFLAAALVAAAAFSVFLLTRPGPDAGASRRGAEEPSASRPGIEVPLTEEERAWLRDHPGIRVVQDPGWPPVEYADAEGRPTGLSNDYLELVERRLGVRMERVTGLTWQEAYGRLRRHEIDVTTSVAVTAEREGFWAFTRPYLTIPIVILTHRDVTYVSGLEDLAGRRVAVVDGYVAAEWIARDHPAVRLVKVRNVREGLDRVESGDVFALVDNMLVISHYLTVLGTADLKIAGETPYVNAQCMAVRRDWAILAGILDKALDTVGAEERAALYSRWVPILYEHRVDSRTLWRLGALFAVVLAGLGLWIRRLFLEIRQRKEAEASLRRSEEELRKLGSALEQSPVMVVITDLEGRIEYVNRRFTDVTGYSAEEALGRDPGFLKSGDKDQEEYRVLWETIRAGREWRGEFRNRRKDGTPYWEQASIAPVRDVSGRAAHYLAVKEDITAQKALEAQLLQARKMESVGRLAGGVAHDFNNMLQVIGSSAEIATRLLGPSHPAHRHLGQIGEAARRSADLTRRLLAFARQQTASPRVLDLNAAVTGMLAMLRRLIGEGIRLSWKPESGLWPVRIDPSQLDQILVNLAVNARDAITGTGNVTVETRNVPGTGAGQGDSVELSVGDDGCGMDAETLGRLFEPFFTTKAPGKGTGLGTATVYGIVKQNGGTIDVTSAPEAGTTFRILLPRAAEASAPAPDPAAPRLPAEGTAPRGAETVLVVEDEEAILEVAREVLEAKGYRVLTARDPHEAVRTAEEHEGEIRLLLTDVVMPGMDGKRLADALRARRPGLRCLFMSGYTANVIDRFGVLEEGMDLLAKPFGMEELARKVREVLDRR